MKHEQCDHGWDWKQYGSCPMCEDFNQGISVAPLSAQAKSDEPTTAAARVQPATALPFRAINRNDLLKSGDRIDHYWEIEGGRGYLCDETTGFSMTGWMPPRDARYIVHAANAYPRLIEALQKAVDDLWTYAANQRAREAEAVLRELGESVSAQENAEAK